MSRLVLIRVGDPNGAWAISNIQGKWSSPENHSQVVRNVFVEGYSVIAVFVGTGDVPLIACKITDVKPRQNDEAIIPMRNELGELKTILKFNYPYAVRFVGIVPELYENILEYAKYKQGSQILIPNSETGNFIPYFNGMNDILSYRPLYMGNTTYFNRDYLVNLNINGC